MAENSNSKSLKAGSTTYYFDIKQSKKDTNYLVITSSWPKGKNGERGRSSVMVFPEHVKEFVSNVNEMAENL